MPQYRSTDKSSLGSTSTLASKALAKVLLDSIGPKNQVLLKTLHPTLKIYALAPRQIVDAMFDKHGIPQSEDIIIASGIEGKPETVTR